jgi:hypothetical protein
MSDNIFSHGRTYNPAEAVYEQRPEILETIEFFGLNPDLTAQYVCASFIKMQYVYEQRFEEAGRMRDVQRGIKEMYTEGQQMVLSVLDVSLSKLTPSFSTRH